MKREPFALLLWTAGALACSRDRSAAVLEGGAAAASSGQRAPGDDASTRAHGPVGLVSPGTGDAMEASPMATMKLLDPGQPPRHALRYAWRADQKEQLEMDLRTAVSPEADQTAQPEIPLPPVHVVVAIDPQGVSPEGDMRYAWRVTSSAVLATDEQVAAQMAESMKTEVATIQRLSGTAVVTSRGLAKDTAVDPASIKNVGGTGQMVEQVRQMLRDLAAPFPEEDVGRGARWQKLSQLSAKDARVTQTDTFTLVDVAANKGTLEDVLAQTAPPQPLRGPPALHGVQAQLESMLASGDARTRFDLSRLVPQMESDWNTTMVVSGQSPADLGRRTTMIVRVGIILMGSTR